MNIPQGNIKRIINEMYMNINRTQKTFWLANCLLFSSLLFANFQNEEVINISRFGIKGDGRTDNTKAFKSLSDYINRKGGNVTVVFQKGVYMAGTQDKTLKREGFYLAGADVLALKNVSNVTIKGEDGAILKYNNNLFFGSFEVPSMRRMNVGRDFYKPGNAAYVGNFISITNSTNINIENLTLDGNAEKAIGGGVYGDVGIQIPYTGLNIINTQNVIVRNLVAENFGLDGVIVSNRLGIAKADDRIYFYDCRFSRNGRQGMSWISGNQLEARNCRFELTGKGKFSSAPGAGLDIESEEHPIRNGRFVSCIFFDNTGCAMVSETGDSGDCSFDSCSFVGLTNWSVWVKKPGFTFTYCTFWGSGVHGYSAESPETATKFLNCRFTDEAYEGKHNTYGNYLYESNGIKRLLFQDCVFEANNRKLIWLDGSPFKDADENYQLINCALKVNTKLSANDFYVLLRKVTLRNNEWELGENIRINRNIASGIDVENQTNVLINNRKNQR
jgi:hypothetical protein